MSNKPRPFRAGDEIRWEWAGPINPEEVWSSDGLWFNARLVEPNPAAYPGGWACDITDPGRMYAAEEMDCPVGWRVYVDERSCTLIAAGPS